MIIQSNQSASHHGLPGFSSAFSGLLSSLPQSAHGLADRMFFTNSGLPLFMKSAVILTKLSRPVNSQNTRNLGIIQGIYPVFSRFNLSDRAIDVFLEHIAGGSHKQQPSAFGNGSELGDRGALGYSMERGICTFRWGQSREYLHLFF